MNKWLQNDLILRFISIGIAIILWGSITNVSFPFSKEGTFRTRIHKMDIEARVDHNQFELIDFNPKADLLLEGDPYIKYLSYRLFVDLRKLKAGRYKRIPIQVEGLPPGVKYQIRPSTVDVKLESKIQKEIPVRINVVGDVSPGYIIGKPNINPSKVYVSGLKHRLDRLVSVRAFVYLGKGGESIHRLVKLEAYGTKGPIQGIRISPKFVNIKIPITSPYKEVPLKIEIEKGLPTGYAIDSITQDIKRIKVYGPEEYIKNLSFYKAKLDLSKIKKSCTIRLAIPLQDKARNVNPRKMKLYIKVAPIQTKVINNIPIQIKGLNEGLKGNFLYPLDGKLTITLRGVEKYLNPLNADNIKAFVNVSSLSTGIYTVSIHFQLPLYIEIVDMEKLEAKIKLDKS